MYIGEVRSDAGRVFDCKFYSVTVVGINILCIVGSSGSAG